MPKKKENLSPEERLIKAVIPKEEEPYTLPDNWVWTTSENIFTEISSNNKKIKQKDYLIEGKIPVIDQGKNFIGGYTNNTKMDLYKKELPVTIFGDHTLNLKYIDFPFVIGADGVKVLKTINFYNSKFLYYCIKNLNLKSLGYRRHFPILKLEKFQFPPLEEQKRIVEKLDSLFEKTGRIKEIIEEVKEKTSLRREVVLSKAFTGELTEKWRAENKTENAKELLLKINDEKIKLWEDECKKAENDGRKKPAKPKLKGIDEMLVSKEEEPYKLPSNWVWTKLGNLSLKLTDGSHNPPKNQNSNYRMLSAKNIFNRKINFFEDDRRISKEDFEKENSRTKLENNDIVLTIVGTIGRTALVKATDINLTFQRSVAVIKTFILQEYLELFMNSKFFNQELYKNAKGTAQLGIYLNKLKDLKIAIPPLEEQKEIVRILDKVFEEEDKISELISLEEKVEILEKTILDKAFRGELGTGNTDDEPAIELLKRALEENK